MIDLKAVDFQASASNKKRTVRAADDSNSEYSAFDSEDSD